MQKSSSSNWGIKGLIGGAGCGIFGMMGCMVAIMMFAMIVIASAGSILGWLFGGGAPSGQGQANQTPGGQVSFWTPTPIPPNCFVTPTAVAVTVTPAPNTPTPPPSSPGVQTPGPAQTPGPTNTSQVVYLPTATPCPTPRNGWSTPDPAWTPEPPGVGPHNTPYRPFGAYEVTQNYGCTDFPEFYDQACANANGRCKGCAFYFHRGFDMVGLSSKIIHSTMSGEVVFVGWSNEGLGNRIYIRQGPYLTINPHLSQIYVGVGQTVAWGQPIGVEGSTGYSTGSHFHYEIHVNGAWVDPTYYLARP